VRHKSEVFLFLAVTAFAVTGITAMRLIDDDEPRPLLPLVEPAPPATQPAAGAAAEWFRSIRMYCNHVEIDTHLRWQPAPGGAEGDMYRAACYALAGRTEQARAVILDMPRDRRYQAAGAVFEAIHPAADAGDETAAGPLMELVVEFWPNHYMALYHAGAAAFERGEYGPAWNYLERFLEEYQVEDGWRTNAQAMLETMTRIEG
jgi:hypothetical protein